MKLLTLTDPADAVEDVAGLTLTAVGAQQVDTTMTFADHFSDLTLINICRGERNRERNQMYLLCFVLQEKGCWFFFCRTNTACAIIIEVVSSATVDRVPLADVGADCVDTDLSSVAWLRLRNTFINI